MSEGLDTQTVTDPEKNKDEGRKVGRLVQYLDNAIKRKGKISQQSLTAFLVLGYNHLTLFLEVNRRSRDIGTVIFGILWMFYHGTRDFLHLLFLRQWSWEKVRWDNDRYNLIMGLVGVGILVTAFIFVITIIVYFIRAVVGL